MYMYFLPWRYQFHHLSIWEGHKGVNNEMEGNREAERWEEGGGNYYILFGGDRIGKVGNHWFTWQCMKTLLSNWETNFVENKLNLFSTVAQKLPWITSGLQTFVPFKFPTVISQNLIGITYTGNDFSRA